LPSTGAPSPGKYACIVGSAARTAASQPEVVRRLAIECVRRMQHVSDGRLPSGAYARTQIRAEESTADAIRRQPVVNAESLEVCESCCDDHVVGKWSDGVHALDSSPRFSCQGVGRATEDTQKPRPLVAASWRSRRATEFRSMRCAATTSRTESTVLIAFGVSTQSRSSGKRSGPSCRRCLRSIPCQK
jgi:hypothetical protein